MPYSTHAQLTTAIGEAELIQLSDRPERADPENAGTPDWTVIDAAAARADARINRYLGAYLPLVNVPDDFVQIHCAITRYFLYNDLPTEHVLREYQEAIKYLEAVASGKIPLGPDALGVTEEKTAGDVDFSSTDTVFNTTTLGGF